MDLESLRQQFSDPGVEFAEGPGGLPLVVLRHALGSVTVAFNGAHVIDYRTAGDEPVLWLSRESHWVSGKPIRGGVPICWPWFGPHPQDASKPAHGFARNSEWQLIGAASLDSTGWLEFELTESEESLRLWPHAFRLRYRIELLNGSLRLALTTENRASRPITLSSALHSYFAIQSISEARITGFDGVEYLDQLDGSKVKRQGGDIRFDREVDQIFLASPDPITIHGSTLGRAVKVNSEGSQSTVVWNPWIDKAKRMPDFGDEEYREMLCVETANAGYDQIDLAAGASHSLVAFLTA